MSDRRSVLVTGASGFIGRHVLPCLARRGYQVHAVGRARVPMPEGAIIWHCTDLLAPGAAAALVAMVRPSHLLHLAWTTSNGEFWVAPDNVDWAAASLCLYRSFAACGGERAVVAGTCAEYDWAHDWLDEASTPCNPSSLYGAAKDALHRVLRAAAPQDGVSLAWGRLFSVYGPYEAKRRLVPSVVRPLLRGEPARCGAGLVERDFLHVEDVAEALAMVLDSDHAGAVNVASGSCLPLRDIMQMIGRRIGRPDLLRLGALPPRPREPARLAANTAILRDKLGFVPRYSLADGIGATIAWWQAYG